jgi:hypothetical protein
MGRKQFLQSRAGNWSKVAMRTSLVLCNRFFVAPKICSDLGINPHKRPLGQHSKFCARQFESISRLRAPNGQFCSFRRRLNHLRFHPFSVYCDGRPQWSPQNRPTVVRAKPANGKRPGTQ